MGKKKRRRLTSAYTPTYGYNEGAPLQTSSPSCNSTALAPRDLSLVHDLPSQDSRPNGGYYPAAQSRFGRFLALTVPSAVGLVTHVPLRLYPDEKSPLQRTATRRHRTQLYEILGSFEQFFRKVTYFVKKRGTPCAARHSRFTPKKVENLNSLLTRKNGWYILLFG